MWSVDSMISLIVVSTNALVAKSFDQHLRRISIQFWIKSQIQKAVVLGTVLIVRRRVFSLPT